MRAATMAGDPKPCVMREKCVRWRWIVGSRICWGRVLHSGERSWFRRSINSLVITLEKISYCLEVGRFHSIVAFKCLACCHLHGWSYFPYKTWQSGWTGFVLLPQPNNCENDKQLWSQCPVFWHKAHTCHKLKKGTNINNQLPSITKSSN